MKCKCLMATVLFLFSTLTVPSVSADSFTPSIESVELAGNLISPNQDGQFDQTQLMIELNQARSLQVLVWIYLTRHPVQMAMVLLGLLSMRNLTRREVSVWTQLVLIL